MSVLLAVAMGSATISAGRPMDEGHATELVAKAMRQMYPSESLRCFSFMTEDRSRKAFDIAVRENHERGCGGDSNVMPVRDRFWVGRSPIRLWRLNTAEETLLRCSLRHGQPICPRLTYK